VLFSSEGLTLLALDHVYIFKCRLHTYSRTLSPTDLTVAVDELRRLVLAQQGRRITKGYLMRAYDWLGVSLAALVDVNEGYKVAYGGEKRWGGIEVLEEERRSPPPLKTSFGAGELRMVRTESSISPASSREVEVEGSAQGVYNAVMKDDRRPRGKAPTGFESIESLPEDRGPHRRGATTPNGFEDITPVTNGEWLCLMVGDGWKEARTAPVVTC
jgi:hypothetical protein